MKTKLPAGEIKALLERTVGPVADFEPLPEGLASQTYGFRLGPERMVVRVGGSIFGYRKDAFAWRTFASPSLPIPDVVNVDTIDEVAVCVSRRAPGRPLRDVDGDLSASVIDLMAALRLADTSATRGFGPFDEHGHAASPSWRAFLLQPADPAFTVWSTALDRPAQASVEQAVAALERLAPTHVTSRDLIHGDLGAANLLADAGGVTAIIDWDRAMIGDGAYDEANLLFWREPALATVCSRLSAARSGDGDWARRMVCYQLRICLQELSETLTGLQSIDAGWLLARCSALLGEAQRLG